MKRILMIIISVAIISCSIGCMKAEGNTVKGSASGHALTVTSESVAIGSELISPDISGDNNALFKFAFGNGVSNVKYVKIGEKISLDFGSEAPDNISAEDIFLNQNGEPLYTDKETNAVPLTSEGQKSEFTLNQSIVSLLSSQNPEGRFDIRGFKITAKWKNDTHIFAFVIKTDSGYSLS